MKPINEIARIDFDPFFAEEAAYGTIVDPWPAMAEQRRVSPVSKGSYSEFFGGEGDPTIGERETFTVWTYDFVREVLGNPELFSSAIHHEVAVRKAFGRILLTMDPPDHTRYRKFLQKAFSPPSIARWRETLIRPLIHELIDAFEPAGKAELVSAFTRRFPFEIVFRLLDLPREDIETFQRLAVTQTFCNTQFSREAIDAGEALAAYFQGVLDERRRNPGEDLVSQLARAEVGGEQLEDEIIIAFMRHVLNASADTSFRTTGCLLAALLRDPALLARMRDDPAALGPAVEEALRWEGSVASNFRTLTRDHEMAGVPMPAGSVVYVAQGSANHDEAYFPEPERFDPDRPNAARHLGFGAGPHVCVGMHLARLQIREALAILLERLPGLRLDPDYPPPVIRGFMFRNPAELRVVFP